MDCASERWVERRRDCAERKRKVEVWVACRATVLCLWCSRCWIRRVEAERWVFSSLVVRGIRARRADSRAERDCLFRRRRRATSSGMQRILRCRKEAFVDGFRIRARARAWLWMWWERRAAIWGT